MKKKTAKKAARKATTAGTGKYLVQHAFWTEDKQGHRVWITRGRQHEVEKLLDDRAIKEAVETGCLVTPDDLPADASVAATPVPE